MGLVFIFYFAILILNNYKQRVKRYGKKKSKSKFKYADEQGR